MASSCRSCNAPILWAINSRTGKWMPFDVEPVAAAGPGQFSIVNDTAAAYTIGDEQLHRERFVSHFATCPNAEQHRAQRVDVPPANAAVLRPSGGCQPFNLGGGVTGFVCRRGGRGLGKACSTPGCNAEATVLCDFPLAGKKAGKTCSKALCAKCKRVQPEKLPDGDERDYCPTHDAVAKAQGRLL